MQCAEGEEYQRNQAQRGRMRGERKCEAVTGFRCGRGAQGRAAFFQYVLGAADDTS